MAYNAELRRDPEFRNAMETECPTKKQIVLYLGRHWRFNQAIGPFWAYVKNERHTMVNMEQWDNFQADRIMDDIARGEDLTHMEAYRRIMFFSTHTRS